MTDPTGWQLIEDWRNGVISDEDFASLQDLLRADAEVRQTLRRSMTMDSALRDRAEAELLAPESDIEFAEALRESSQSSRDVGILAAERKITDGQWASKPAVMRLMLATAAVVIVALSAGLIYQRAYPLGGNPETNDVATQRRDSDPSVAKITGLSGALIWTGDRGQIVRDVKVGTELAGGTIEGMAPDSWFELKFNDGSTAMIAGTSTLTFSDFGQKELHLKRGRLSASVVPQPEGYPMLIHTRSAELRVLGTRFEVETELDSTSLHVSEGKVQFKRRSDGRTVQVTAQHRVVTSSDGEMSATPIPSVVHDWKSQLHLDPADLYGKWSAPASDKPASLKAIPFVPQENKGLTLHLLGLPVNRADDSPVVVQTGSRFVVRGRLQIAAGLFLGIRVARPNGDFAGKFLARLPAEQFKRDRDFETVFNLDEFGLDPCVWDRKDELPSKPDDLVVTCVWAFTHTGEPTGLEVAEIELIPPVSQKVR